MVIHMGTGAGLEQLHWYIDPLPSSVGEPALAGILGVGAKIADGSGEADKLRHLWRHGRIGSGPTGFTGRGR